MKRSFAAYMAALSLILFSGVSAQATPIPPDQIGWTYNFTPTAPGNHNALAAVLSDDSASAGVTFTNEPTKAAVGNSDVVASNLRVFSTSTAASPNILNVNGGYGLDLQLSVTDDQGVHTTILHFTGKLTGKLSAEGTNVANVFGPNSTQTVDLGIYTFTVSLIAYTPPGPPDQSNAGSIAATVTVEGEAITQQDGPEPSSMILSALGLSCLGGAAWRKRRARANASV